MGTDLLAARCPSCNAALRPDAQWCSLCHHDLRPAPAPAVVVPSPTPPLYGGPDPLTAPLLDLVLPPVPATAAAAVPELSEEQATAGATWPCAHCQTANPFTETQCTVCGSAFLAGVSTPQSLVLPGFGDLGRFSRGQRVGLACAVAGALLIPLAVFTYAGTPHTVDTKGTTSTTTTSTTTP